MNYFFKKIINLGWLFFFQMSYFFIYYYTKVELLCKPKFNLLRDYIKTKNKKRNKPYTQCEYVKDGIVITPASSVKQYDFMLYSKSTCTTINQIIRTEEIDEPITYEMSNEKFIMVEITIDNDTIPIKFSNEKINYYVVGNLFDNKFMCFFLHRYYPDFCKNKSFLMDTYKLKIIDSNVEVIELDQTSSIIITKDGYNICHTK